MRKLIITVIVFFVMLAFIVGITYARRADFFDFFGPRGGVLVGDKSEVTYQSDNVIYQTDNVIW